ncbi:nucleoside recognition domain-containing protein [Bacteroidota bacterium]
MLNYVWLALLLLGITAALTSDIVDQSSNRYRNGDPLNVELIFNESFSESESKTISAEIILAPEIYNNHYNQAFQDTIRQSVKLTIEPVNSLHALYFKVSEKSPLLWQNMAKVAGDEDDLTGTVEIKQLLSSYRADAEIILEEVSFIKMKEVTNSAIDYAGTAVKIAIGLIGIMALWLGIMKIAEEAGLITIIAKTVRPITRFLFPDVPHDHPAIGSIIMNISANMLGLGNAATPFGLKAMEELDKLNEKKGTATNAMCTFLAINTAGLTLVPATAIAIRAAAGSSDPAIIIGTSFFGATCATIVGILSAKILEKFPLRGKGIPGQFKSNIKGLLILISVLVAIGILLVTGLLSELFAMLGGADTFKLLIQILSTVAIPMIIFLFVAYGALKKVKIYEVFVEGAKEGFNIAVRIIPFLVAMLVAIGIFRAGGAMEFLVLILDPVTSLIGMPAEALPMALMRPLSGSGSLGIMAEIISVHGPDSFIGILVSTIMGSTETTFYVIAVYFGAVNIRNSRHALAAGLLADVAGILGAIFIVHLLFG